MGRRSRRRHEARAVAFVDEHLTTVWRYVAGMLGATSTAREVTRAVLGEVDPPPEAEATAVVRRLARARQAVRRTAPRPAPSADVPRSPAPASPPHQLLRAGLDRLDPDDREALILVDVARLGVEEAAGLCEVSVDELLARRHRAHARLVDELVGGGP